MPVIDAEERDDVELQLELQDDGLVIIFHCCVGLYRFLVILCRFDRIVSPAPVHLIRSPA